jgi:hypothetical protein
MNFENSCAKAAQNISLGLPFLTINAFYEWPHYHFHILHTFTFPHYRSTNHNYLCHYDS